MKRQIIILSLIGILNILLFSSIFKLLQNDKIYNNTIGLISQNYERTGTWNDYKISKVSKPYLKIINENFLQWDASIYNCIKENNYTSEEACYGKVRAAFFPLFPFLWKITAASPILISILNYLMFILSISLLVIYLLPNNIYLRSTTFILFITLPTTVIYMIPYSESLFMLCMTIAVVGLLKDNYPLYFVGIVLLAMVRPATAFVFLAIIASEIFFSLKEKNIKNSFRNSLSKVIPFLVGYLIVISIQYLSSGSWTAFIDAQKYWSGGIVQRITEISDWSSEGFGMNTFSIFVVTLPALAFLIYLALNIKSKKTTVIKFSKKTKRNYLLITSLFYLAGILLYSLLTSGGNFHSLFRFIICSPLFYISAFILIASLSKLNLRLVTTIFSILLLSLFIYFYIVNFGGDRFRFSFFGLYMLVITFSYFLYRRFLPVKIDLILLFLIVVLNTIWNTYMLNIFFSNGWIFT